MQMIIQLTAIDQGAPTPEEQFTPIYIASDKVAALRPAVLDNPLLGIRDAEGNFKYLDADGNLTVPETFQMTLLLTQAGSFAVTEDVGTVLALMQQNVHVATPGAGANPRVN